MQQKGLNLQAPWISEKNLEQVKKVSKVAQLKKVPKIKKAEAMYIMNPDLKCLLKEAASPGLK